MSIETLLSRKQFISPYRDIKSRKEERHYRCFPSGDGRSKHLVIHGSITDSRCRLGDISAASGNRIGVAVADREVVGHFGIQFLNSLLLGTLARVATTTATTAFSTSTTSATLSSSSRRCLRSRRRLWFVLLRLSAAC